MQTIAAWLLQNYQDLLGSPGRVALIELGPGKGTLMKQVLTAFGMMPGGDKLLQACELHLVEVSPGLRQQQYEALQCSKASSARPQVCILHASTRLCRWVTLHVFTVWLVCCAPALRCVSAFFLAMATTLPR